MPRPAAFVIQAGCFAKDLLLPRTLPSNGNILCAPANQRELCSRRPFLQIGDDFAGFPTRYCLASLHRKRKNVPSNRVIARLPGTKRSALYSKCEIARATIRIVIRLAGLAAERHSYQLMACARLTRRITRLPLASERESKRRARHGTRAHRSLFTMCDPG